MLYFGSFKDIDTTKYYKVVLAVRHLQHPVKGDNVIHAPVLAPSAYLIAKIRKEKEAGTFDYPMWRAVFVAEYMSELIASVNAQKTLINLYKAGCEKDILVCCYCPDDTVCHRSVIQGLMQGRGRKQNNDVVVSDKDYSYFYDDFRRLVDYKIKQHQIRPNS